MVIWNTPLYVSLNVLEILYNWLWEKTDVERDNICWRQFHIGVKEANILLLCIQMYMLISGWWGQ